MVRSSMGTTGPDSPEDSAARVDHERVCTAPCRMGPLHIHTQPASGACGVTIIRRISSILHSCPFNAANQHHARSHSEDLASTMTRTKQSRLSTKQRNLPLLSSVWPLLLGRDVQLVHLLDPRPHIALQRELRPRLAAPWNSNCPPRPPPPLPPWPHWPPPAQPSHHHGSRLAAVHLCVRGGWRLAAHAGRKATGSREPNSAPAPAAELMISTHPATKQQGQGARCQCRLSFRAACQADEHPPPKCALSDPRLV